jgi:sugar-specific transcriptional regulator TrmB
VEQDALVDELRHLGFSQYEAQCYLGLLRQHPLNGSQLSGVSGVLRSMVYQTLARLEEKAAAVRLHSAEREPQQDEPVAPAHVIAHLSAAFQATCERLERDLTAAATTPPAEVVLNMLGYSEILERAASFIRQAQRSLSVLGGALEVASLQASLRAATARGVTLRILTLHAG